MQVNIRRSGNILEIEPGRADILAPVLTYTHNSMANMYNPMARDKKMDYQQRELFKIKDGKLYTLQGAYKRVVEALTTAGCECLYTDLREKTVLEPDYDWFAKCMPNLEFRFKQDEILATLIGLDSGVIIAPTAYGKTFIMLALAALYPKANIIMTSPSTALLRSTYKRMVHITPNVGRVGGGYDQPAQVTLCTFGSIMGAPTNKCDILIVDEVHGLGAPVISSRIAQIRSPVKIFGMTATPEGRSDNAHLPIEVMIGPKIAEVDYKEAAEAGVVSNIKVAFIDMGTGTGCKVQGHHYSTKPAKKRNVYWRNTIRNKAFANAVLTYPGKLSMPDNPQTLVLTETTEHAFRLAQFLPGFEVVYAGMTPDRLAKLKDLGLVTPDYKPLTRNQRDNLLMNFEAGKVRRVIATGCWGTGVDFVHLDVVANASGSPSPISTVQWAGRNSRMYEGKSFGLVIDSHDKWDKWAEGRAKLRIREYKKKGWELVQGLEYQMQQELPLENSSDTGKLENDESESTEVES